MDLGLCHYKGTHSLALLFLDFDHTVEREVSTDIFCLHFKYLF